MGYPRWRFPRTGSLCKDRDRFLCGRGGNCNGVVYAKERFLEIKTSVDNGGDDGRPCADLLCFPESKPLH